MSPNPTTFRRIERVGLVYDALSRCEHDCFPVLNAEAGDVLVGTVLRKAVCVILQVKTTGIRLSVPAMRVWCERGSIEKGGWIHRVCPPRFVPWTAPPYPQQTGPTTDRTAQGLLFPPGRPGARGAREPRPGGAVRASCACCLPACLSVRPSVSPRSSVCLLPCALTPPPTPTTTTPPRLLSPLLNWFTLEGRYPRYPSIHDIRLTERVKTTTIIAVAVVVCASDDAHAISRRGGSVVDARSLYRRMHAHRLATLAHSCRGCLSHAHTHRLPPCHSPTHTTLTHTKQDRQCVVDLRPFMNTAPYVINESASAVRSVLLLPPLPRLSTCLLPPSPPSRSTCPSPPPLRRPVLH